MGGWRIEHRRAVIPLCVEPLEDRFLLSTTGISEVGTVAGPTIHEPVASHSRSQSQLLAQTKSVAQAAPSPASIPLPAGKTPQEHTVSVPQAAAAVPPHGVQATSSPLQGTDLPTANPVNGEIENFQALFSLVAPHAAFDGDARGPDQDDDDDDSPGLEDLDDSHVVSSQLIFGSLLAANMGLQGEASTGLGSTPTVPGSLPRTLELLPAFGIGTMPLAWVAAVLPATSAPPHSGEGRGYREPEEGKEMMPPLPEYQLLDLPPLSAEHNEPPTASSPGGPFADFLPIDVAAIQRSADAFFQQLAHLSEEWNEGRVIHRLVPWLLVAGITAYEWVRLRRLRTLSTVGFAEDDGAEPTYLLAEDEQ